MDLAGAPYLVRPASPRSYLDFSEKGGERTVQRPGIESLVETWIIFGSTRSIMCEFLHFEVAHSSMEIMTASVTILGGETNLKNSSINEQKRGRFSSPFRNSDHIFSPEIYKLSIRIPLSSEFLKNSDEIFSTFPIGENKWLQNSSNIFFQLEF